MLISFQVRSGERNQVIPLRRIAIRPVGLLGISPIGGIAGRTMWNCRLQERDFRLTNVHGGVVSGDSKSRSPIPPTDRRLSGKQQQVGLHQLRPQQTIKSTPQPIGDCRDFSYGVH